MSTENPSFYHRVIHSKRKSNLIAVVLLPVIVMAAYYMFLTSDRYVSATSFKIAQVGSRGFDSEGALAAVVGFSSKGDEHVVEEYIRSMDMLLYLQENHQLREHYTSFPDTDFFSRLNTDASVEELYEFYQDHISIHYQELSGLLVVEVQAFSPEFAKALLEAILLQSETMVNEQSLSLAQSQVLFAQEGVKATAKRLELARNKVLDFQDKQDIFSPKQKIRFRALELEAEVALENYATALTAMELARVEASHNLKKLQVISEPFSPEDAAYPKKLYNLVIILIVSLLVFGLLRMLLTTLKEHQD